MYNIKKISVILRNGNIINKSYPKNKTFSQVNTWLLKLYGSENLIGWTFTR